MYEILAALAAGYVAGWLSHLSLTQKPSRPMRLVRHQSIAPAMPALSAIITDMWDTSMQSFTLHADLVGLSEGAMLEAGVCSQRGYRKYSGILKETGIWVATERTRTRWAPGWCGGKVRSFIRRGRLSLPYPPIPPPKLNERFQRTQTTQM